ncbi:hypothetical protein Xbud_01610 [Xenorhabdus budapestensis]|uniref:Uncharacterized protein n=1 Tax=Xenorhabdus budapestensis TaxID=290110 RepID=A0A2D0J1L3_XENBU|nr:hypothetical protein Xbud_01610 [Xenorhabdus budapestensis]
MMITKNSATLGHFDQAAPSPSPQIIFCFGNQPGLTGGIIYFVFFIR